MNKYLLIIILMICSCSSYQQTPIPKKGSDLYWNILENISAKIWTKEKINKIFGEPREIVEDKKILHQESWIYDHSTEGYQEWTFGFDEKDQLIFAKYYPADDFSLEFSLKKLEKRWISFHCEYKTKEILHPHVIRDLTYLSCDHEKRQIEYNNYKEVLSITIKK
ncbi:MAG: hypothetical protein A2381_17715 [Bdellovibrionales bacterium RIFOXYB1_FULL_37_110]|nr:MAG: hypothetical protein A2417_08505 [Bdellovibrionales bacterium RIFOXYC1_FULL_37_79]OFZ59810.1 MAG: hypothetical protein A2381_17715 [Bdellovibrionales bacterium RIFOXYB1_FULL_37_110]OFZ65425.1 MAG: hypothetical protein A2577_18250 [Bdellovibrionales bacterium RIFOXYD1_FULL_36_51]